MKQLLLFSIFAFSLLTAQEDTVPAFLQPESYDHITQKWINDYIIYQNTKNDIVIKETISPQDMNTLLNALYFCFQWVDYEEKAHNDFAQAIYTFVKVKSLMPSGVTSVYNINTYMQILAKQLSACMINKDRAYKAYYAYCKIEPRLKTESLAIVWNALEHDQAEIGQELLAYNNRISTNYLQQAEEKVAQSLVSIRDAQRFMNTLATTINKTDVENLVEMQNSLINRIQDDVDAAIETTYSLSNALESLQIQSTNLERSIYRIIFYVYYRALYNAMKMNNVSDQYFAMIPDKQDEIVVYLQNHH